MRLVDGCLECKVCILCCTRHGSLRTCCFHDEWQFRTSCFCDVYINAINGYGISMRLVDAVRVQNMHFVLYKACVFKSVSLGPAVSMMFISMQLLRYSAWPWHLQHVNDSSLECKVCIFCCTKHGSLITAIYDSLLVNRSIDMVVYTSSHRVTFRATTNQTNRI